MCLDQPLTNILLFDVSLSFGVRLAPLRHDVSAVHATALIFKNGLCQRESDGLSGVAVQALEVGFNGAKLDL